MIELITGNPGSGKTTFAVAMRLCAEVGRPIEVPAEDAHLFGLRPGETLTRRLVVAGIRGLVVDHEPLPHTLTGHVIDKAATEEWNRVDSNDEPVHKRLPGQPAQDVEATLFNWWLWCRPGDLIVVDEVQFIAPRGTLGKKPPLWAALLEVHRHYGVDFLFITQQPGLVDTTIKALCGMHRHVRSVFGLPFCMVYVWDHASNPERYTNATKSKFVRRKKYYRLFKSTSLVVKPPTSGRGALVALPLFIALAIGAAYVAAGKISGGSKVPIASANAATLPARQADSPLVVQKRSARPSGFEDVPELSGCWSVGDDCQCMSKEGRAVHLALPMCKQSSSGFEGLVAWEPRAAPLQSRYGAAAAGGQGGAAAAASPAVPASAAKLFNGPSS